MGPEGYEEFPLTEQEAADLAEIRKEGAFSAQQSAAGEHAMGERMVGLLRNSGDLIERILRARGMELGDVEVQVSEDEKGKIAMWTRTKPQPG